MGDEECDMETVIPQNCDEELCNDDAVAACEEIMNGDAEPIQDCELDVETSAAACTSSCGKVTAVVGTPQSEGGAECEEQYTCRLGDGDCTDNYVTITSQSCEAFGLNYIVTTDDCKSAFKFFNDASSWIVNLGPGVASGHPYGCHLAYEQSLLTGQWSWELYTTSQAEEATEDCSETTKCYCSVATHNPTLFPSSSPVTSYPTRGPTASLKQMEFETKIQMSEADATANKENLKESLATVLNMDKNDVEIAIIPAASARRMLQEGYTTIEVTLFNVADVDATTNLVTGTTFETDLQAKIEETTNLDGIAVCCTTEPAVVLASTSTEDEDTNFPVSAIVIPLLFCCCCAVCAYYLFQNAQQKYEIENEKKEAEETEQETGV